MALYFLIFAVILVFFPITVTFYIFFNKSEQKLYFAIYAFNRFLVLSGYFTVRNAYSVYLHIKNRAYIITLNNIVQMSNKSGGGTFFTPLSLYLYVDSAVNLVALSFLMLLNTGFSIFNSYSHVETPYFKNFYSFSLINDVKKEISIKASLTVTFNIFCILRLIITNSIIKRRKARG